MVRAAYGSGKPAYGVGAGNATMVIDETADVEEAARNTRISKTNDHGSGCSADGNLLVDASHLRRVPRRSCSSRAAISSTSDEKAAARRRPTGTRRGTARRTRSRGPRAVVAAKAGFTIPDDKTLLHRRRSATSARRIRSPPKSSASCWPIFKYHGFDMALDMVRQIFETGGKGHSCGIYSFDDEHIHRLALVAPVSRMMVRQVQSSSNAGTFTNGMPMTSSMGCGIWGGNITNENISLKHYMNVTWVSRPIAGRPPVRAGTVRRVL